MILFRLDGSTCVAGQIAPDQMDEIAAAGIRTVVNNRPDHEEGGQPEARAIEQAARSAGLAYRFIPVAGGISGAEVDAMADTLAAAPGPVLAFCRSGTRSCYLWALARASLGDDPGELLAKAGAAGFDLAPIAAFLHSR